MAYRSVSNSPRRWAGRTSCYKWLGSSKWLSRGCTGIRLSPSDEQIRGDGSSGNATGGEAKERATMTTMERSDIRVDDYVPTDEFFGAPFIDLDESREDPVPHRYLHGGFE